ncbi:peptidoglycan-binding protein [Paenibacillus guangzhouensis]|uniref:peptidoglycan-binding protein n=1 Tax=Paenibacillus guangzhouensis TaxID=1473112 RepID=UPI002239188B|nr:peptidoglycan-binding protein [Paenibacillus guangzhouensis]
MNGVKHFQKRHGLPVTGTVDERQGGGMGGNQGGGQGSNQAPDNGKKNTAPKVQEVPGISNIGKDNGKIGDEY